MKESYVPIRAGILEHLLRGDISACEFGVYGIIHLQADYASGVWRGSAPRIANSAPRGADLRKIQRALEHLAQLGLLKLFHRQGVRGNYPVLINKFTVRSGALKGQRLNADLTTNWRKPVYERCAETDTDATAVVDAVDAPIQEVRSKKEEKREKPAAKTTPPADPRFQPFVDFAFAAFNVKHGQKPVWLAKDYRALRDLLGKAPSLALSELHSRWENYLQSTEPFTAKQGWSLTYFCSNVDKFLTGPILAAGKGGINADQRTRDNLRAAGFLQ
jgi:hypothetical protein